MKSGIGGSAEQLWSYSETHALSVEYFFNLKKKISVELFLKLILSIFFLKNKIQSWISSVPVFTYSMYFNSYLSSK